MSIGAGYGDLNLVLADIKEVRIAAKTFMTTQNQGNVSVSLCIISLTTCVAALFEYLLVEWLNSLFQQGLSTGFKWQIYKFLFEKN